MTRPLHRPMRARRPDEAHRASTPLELLFDLCFVVAVSFAAARLHEALTAGEVGRGVVGFGTVFFAIWWAWMNFSWFASAYDTDDVPYRVAVLVQITGVLVLAAGVPAAFAGTDFRLVTIGYVVMRVSAVTQWARAAHDDPARRGTALRHAAGFSALTVGWLVRLALTEPWSTGLLAFLVIGELLVPVWAGRAGPMPWHPGHMVERYSLFTLIVLGECVLATTTAMGAALTSSGASIELLVLALAALLIVFSLWWLYFDQPADQLLTSFGSAIGWGYGHLLVFASLAALGAGLQAQIDQAHDDGHQPDGLAVGIPLAIFLISVWLLHIRPRRPNRLRAAFPITAVVVLTLTATLATSPTAATLGAAAALTTLVVTITLAGRRRR